MGARKAAIAVAAFATVGSTLFGGAALAGGHGYGDTENVGGPGGSGGDANANCLIPIGISLGLLGQGGDVSQCNATGGVGGAGGTGADY
ncbi:hypothetical protein [Pseudonocardia sp. MH-G8]|uniref:hypothetical protein n=1 Tax=Pseudonocardia sp. MH-G8 TaxID=1854588 RepID=UPI00117AF047|nr:hypothetical protein [Pseudonocardia sp. MH-G8]